MRSLIKVHSLLEKLFGPLPQLDLRVIVELGGGWVFGLVGIGLIYLPLFWLLHPTKKNFAE